MATNTEILSALIDHRAYKIRQIDRLRLGLREYIKYPVDTVNYLDLQNQYDFVLREIKRLDLKIKISLDNALTENRVTLQTIASDLLKLHPVFEVPKLHHSMFNQIDKAFEN